MKAGRSVLYYVFSGEVWIYFRYLYEFSSCCRTFSDLKKNEKFISKVYPRLPIRKRVNRYQFQKSKKFAR